MGLQMIKLSKWTRQGVRSQIFFDFFFEIISCFLCGHPNKVEDEPCPDDGVLQTEIKTETDNYDWVLGQGDSVFINEDGFFAEDDPYAHETQQIAYIDDTLQEMI